MDEVKTAPANTLTNTPLPGAAPYVAQHDVSKLRAELTVLGAELRTMISAVHSRLSLAEHALHGHVAAVDDVIHARVDALEDEVAHFAEKVHARIGSVL